MSVFQQYASYYNLLYKDKDYAGEAAYVHQLLQKHAPSAQTLLEFGCGTGQHARYLARHGYRIHGIDQSAEMLRQAQTLQQELPQKIEEKLTWSQGDIRAVRLQQKFDAIISLFHVLSYQTTNTDLHATFATARYHLNPGGIFLFDCWYGPGVLSDLPTIRIKRMEDEQIIVTRIAEPVMYPNENYVDVKYQVFIKDKASGRIKEFQESHRMRYLFAPELQELFACAGMRLIGSYHNFSERPPELSTWNAYFIGKHSP